MRKLSEDHRAVFDLVMAFREEGAVHVILGDVQVTFGAPYADVGLPVGDVEEEVDQAREATLRRLEGLRAMYQSGG